MCKCCTETQRKFLIFGFGTFFALISLILALVWPKIAEDILFSKLVLKNDSLNYNNWIKTPFPMYMHIKLWNWTNADQVHDHSVKPSFVEMGPYVFSEIHERTALNWHPDNNTITFNQTRTWQFLPELSNGSLDDIVTNLNVMTASVAYNIRDSNAFFKRFANMMVNNNNGSLFISKSVRELLFDGYDDPLLDFLISTNSPMFNIPFKKFGWFVERNQSASYDGVMNMYTGAGNIRDLGKINTWNGINKTKFYNDKCSLVNGTTGELWPPQMNPKSPITLFVTDVCRSLTLNYDSDISVNGLVGSKWIGDESLFDNGLKYPKNLCYCTESKNFPCPQLMSGVLDISSCRFGAPAFVSFPHFYLADQSYLNDIDGLKPNKSEHEFSLALEPSTGIPLKVNARLQINILLQPIDGIDVYKNVPKLIIPMFWFSQTIELPDDLALQAKLAVMVPYMGTYLAFGFGCLGIILLTIGLVFTISKRWQDILAYARFENPNEDDELLQ